MSDFDDIDDQLLELAGANPNKKKRHSSGGGAGERKSGSKKRKAERLEDDDRESVESEEQADDPYPLEGLFKDETDRRDIMAMTEIRREEILEERREQRQARINAREIASLVRQQQVGAAGADDSVSRAAKRQHQARGATKEKAHKLDELKAKRKAKDDKKRSHPGSSPNRDRSSSPQDMDISDSESEDGQISKEQQREDKLLGLASPNKRAKLEKDDESACTLADIEKCRLSRELIAKYCSRPWFQDYVIGAWVRYLIGNDEVNGAPVYRICQISDLAPNLVKPYMVDDKPVNQAVELQHGKSKKIFNMDKKEFDRLVKTCLKDGVPMPTKQSLERKLTQMQKLVSQPITEADISAMIERNKQLKAGATSAQMGALERSRLIQQLTLAERRQDYDEAAEIKAKLDAANAYAPTKKVDSAADLLAKVNERNRKANMEAVRQAELAEAEKKRRERKLAARGVATPADPSARLKIVPRTFNSNTPAATRPGTPANGSPAPQANPSSADTASKAPVKKSTFEDTLINSVEVDLGDF